MLLQDFGRGFGFLCRAFSSAIVAVWVFGALGAADARALTLDFESLSHGQVANGSLDGVSIKPINPNRIFDLAVAFDTRLKGTSDLDLEVGEGWSAGNLVGEQLGMILILQENDLGCKIGICLDPDDEGRRPAGEILFGFEKALTDFGFDLVDIESISAEAAFIDLFDGTASATVALMDFLNPGSDRYDATIELGNNSANRFAPITAASVGLQQIDGVRIRLGGSGGIDNLTGTVVPEPTSALLIGLGLAALAGRPGRRR